MRQLLGDQITLKPAKDRSHLGAHLQFSRAALLGAQIGGRRVVGSGGMIQSYNATQRSEISPSHEIFFHKSHIKQYSPINDLLI
jgi:hypothetical protein